MPQGIDTVRRDCDTHPRRNGAMEAGRQTTVETAVTRHPRHRVTSHRRFFAAFACAATLATFVGFAPTYYLRGFFDATSLPLRIHVHGAIFTAWVLLFLTQTVLVAARRTALHRRLGVLGALLVVPMLVSGLVVAVSWARGDSPITSSGLETESRLALLVIPFASVVLFASLSAPGLYYRRRADVHKRFMLLGTTALLPPALGRIPILAAAGPIAFFGVTVAFILAAVAYDYFTLRRLHPVSLWGDMVLAASFPGRLALGNTEAWKMFARWLIGD
jgi:hypothetical protein